MAGGQEDTGCLGGMGPSVLGLQWRKGGEEVKRIWAPAQAIQDQRIQPSSHLFSIFTRLKKHTKTVVLGEDVMRLFFEKDLWWRCLYFYQTDELLGWLSQKIPERQLLNEELK